MNVRLVAPCAPDGFAIKTGCNSKGFWSSINWSMPVFFWEGGGGLPFSFTHLATYLLSCLFCSMFCASFLFFTLLFFIIIAVFFYFVGTFHLLRGGGVCYGHFLASRGGYLKSSSWSISWPIIARMKRFFFPLKPPITQGSWWSRLIRLYFFNPFFKFLLHSSSFGVFPIVSSGLSDDTVAMQMRRWTSEKRKMRIFSSALSSPCGVKNPSFGRPPL